MFLTNGEGITRISSTRLNLLDLSVQVRMFCGGVPFGKATDFPNGTPPHHRREAIAKREKRLLVTTVGGDLRKV